MSRVYFHSLSETVEISGSERAYANILLNNIAYSCFGGFSLRPEKHWLKNFIPQNHDIHKTSKFEFEDSLKLLVCLGDLPIEIPGNIIRTYYCKTYEESVYKTDSFSLNLNTAIAIGGDELKLLARLNAQCEIHCFVEGKNKLWLANIILAGLEKSILRQSSGWKEVVRLLIKNETESVVMSYSVCDPFPNKELLSQSILYHELDKQTKWNSCMRVLRESEQGLELSPDTWNNFSFDYNINYFNLKAIAESMNPLL